MSRTAVKYDGQEVGIVGYVHMHSFECTGTINLTQFGETFRPLWSHIENIGIDDIPFEERLMDNSLWAMDSDGKILGIYFPMVYGDYTIIWRWRLR